MSQIQYPDVVQPVLVPAPPPPVVWGWLPECPQPIRAVVQVLDPQPVFVPLVEIGYRRRGAIV